jgi:hypothetical protein
MNFAAHLGATPVGLRPPCVAPKCALHQPENPGRNPLIFSAELFRQTEPPLLARKCRNSATSLFSQPALGQSRVGERA